MKLYFERENKVKECTKETVIKILGYREIDFYRLYEGLKRLGIYIVDTYDNLKVAVDRYDTIILERLGPQSNKYILWSMSNDFEESICLAFKDDGRHRTMYPTEKGTNSLDDMILQHTYAYLL